MKHLNVVSRSSCAVSNVLDLIGDKWTLLVVRDIIFYEKHEYKDFLTSPEAIATNILSSRLKKMREVGIIAEAKHPESKLRKLYFLTKAGKDLLPMMIEIVLWADKYLPPSAIMKPIAQMSKRDKASMIKNLLQKAEIWERENLQVLTPIKSRKTKPAMPHR